MVAIILRHMHTHLHIYEWLEMCILFVCNQPYGLLAGSLTVNVETCCVNMVVVVVLYVCELECVCVCVRTSVSTRVRCRF